MANRAVAAIVFGAMVTTALPAIAAIIPTPSQLFVFGDSLSDPGNLSAATGGTNPPAPYFQGRFSNGPVWTEYLAQSIGRNVRPFWQTQVPAPGATAFGQGINFAFGGARTDALGNANGVATAAIPGVAAQVGFFNALRAVPGNTINSDALFIVRAGANDFFSGVTNPVVSATNLRNTVTTLASYGARNFLIVDLPDVGLTPAFRGTPLQSAASLWANGFNAALAGAFSAPIGGVVNLDFFSSAALFTATLSNPAAFGITNVTDQCITSAVALASNCAGYLFFDSVHPTTQAHLATAQAARALGISEPATLALFGLGGAALMAFRRRKAA
jgi:phospholipase/lecithinase/hemolysin